MFDEAKMKEPIKVLIVDDSALVRKMLTDLLNQHAEIEVVGTAQDGSFVMQKLQSLKPDVITLDVEMRNTGGLEILPEIVKVSQVPVIMVSAHTERGAESTLKALELGAFDFVTKPQAGGSDIQQIAEELTGTIIMAGRNKRRSRPVAAAPPKAPPRRAPVNVQPARQRVGTIDLIAIGASTGGTEAIKEILVRLPNTLPGIVITQHMPAGFTQAFAQRLNSLCQIAVAEGSEGAPITPGTAYIAPGGKHMEVVRAGGGYKLRISESPPVNRHRPSVDVLFDSVSKVAGRRALGALLTGMGADGARGLLQMKQTGAMTIGQDEATCVVYGMPREAAHLGAVSQVLPLQQIASFLVKSVSSNGSQSRVASAR